MQTGRGRAGPREVAGGVATADMLAGRPAATPDGAAVLRFTPPMTTQDVTVSIDNADSPREIAFRSSAARPGALRLITQGWSEIWTRRRLIIYLARADLKKKGSDTLLGNLWWVIDPLLQMMVYVVLVDFIFHKSVPDYPLFIFCAILPWKWFTSSTYDRVTSVVGQERLIKQIHFPKIILPVASSSAAVANFVFGLIPLFTLEILFYRERLTWHVIFIPYIAFVEFAFIMAFSTMVSAVNVFFRDIGNVVRHALRLWFYLSPGLYSLDQLQTQMKDNQLVWFAVNVNPWTWIFESYRQVLYYGLDPYWLKLAAVFVFSVFFFAFSTFLFKRVEPSFAKVL
jgi:ABC-type polysaccharide/polyol phosphate export permease